MTKLRLGLLTLLLTALPGAAHAQGGWWDTIEQYSGPGPFSNGGVAEIQLGCFGTKGNPAWMWLAHAETTRNEQTKKDETHHPCFSKDPSYVSGYINVRYVRATTSDDQPLFQDRPDELKGKLTAHNFQVLAMHRLVPAVAIGAGGGFLALSGSNLNKGVHSWTVTPFSVSVTPLRFLGVEAGWKGKVARLVTFNFEEVAVIGSFVATDFNSTSTSRFSTTTELHRSYSLVVDVLQLVN
jgi:hypothetical protein